MQTLMIIFLETFIRPIAKECAGILLRSKNIIDGKLINYVLRNNGFVVYMDTSTDDLYTSVVSDDDEDDVETSIEADDEVFINLMDEMSIESDDDETCLDITNPELLFDKTIFQSLVFQIFSEHVMSPNLEDDVSLTLQYCAEQYIYKMLYKAKQITLYSKQHLINIEVIKLMQDLNIFDLKRAIF